MQVVPNLQRERVRACGQLHVDDGAAVADVYPGGRTRNRLAIDDWPTIKIAQELNDLGVPTSYAKDNRMGGDRENSALEGSGALVAFAIWL